VWRLPALGGVSALLLLSGGVLAGGDPQVARELARVGEAIGVADLSDQSQGGARGDAAEGAQRPDPLAPGLPGRDLLELAIQRIQLTIQAIEMHERLLERRLGE
jgi:hypothetical protein